MQAPARLPSLPFERLGAFRHDWLSLRDVTGRLQELAQAEPPSDADRALRNLLTTLLAGGLQRRIGPLTDPDDVLALRAGFPNFEPVIDCVAGQLALQRVRGGAPLPMTPLLLLGSPGIGKTTFAERLAQTLGVPHRVLPMSAMTAGFTLGGLDRGWAHGRPGQVFQILNTGAINPVITLDEIDKANDAPQSSPLGTLYQLLEPTTARCFVDEYLGLPMDASLITWVATANDERAVPPALLSRLRVFEIDAPTPTQMRPIVTSQYALLRRSRPALRETLDETVLARLCTLEPRSARMALHEAAGCAALRSVRAGLNRIAVTAADLDGSTPGRRRPACGFIG